MCNVWETIKVSGYSINQILVSLTAALVVFVTYTTMLTVFSFLDPLRVFIIWLQWYARSDWLFSCNDQALLARCPRHIQSVFNFMIVDILMDIHVMVNWQLSKRYPLTSVTRLIFLKVILMDIHVMVNWQRSKFPLTSVTWLYLLISYMLTICWF